MTRYGRIVNNKEDAFVFVSAVKDTVKAEIKCNTKELIMLYRQQKDFQEFKCIADKCPKSCCVGWQIVIDGDSLRRYNAINDNPTDMVASGIDFSECCFKQDKDGRCSMLSDRGLCNLQSKYGEDFLCYTCKTYPRHVEEFPDVREYSLSLSCPEAVRMLLDTDYSFSLEELEDDMVDTDDYEDFDIILFDKLVFARDKLLDLASDSSIPFQQRLDIITSISLLLQRMYDEGDLFSMDEIDYTSVHIPDYASLDYNYCLSGLDVLIELESLEASWTEQLIDTRSFWNNQAAEVWQRLMSPSFTIEHAFEKVFESMLFSYFCGAAYDGQIYARTMIAVQSVRWMLMLYYADGNRSLDEIIYLFSREIEHSDLNINALILYFEKNI